MTQDKPTNPTKQTPGAIVLGGNAIALGVVRSLGVQGIPVWVFDTSRSIAHFSKYTKRSVISQRDKYDLLLEEGRKHSLNGWVIFPVEDQYVELLSVHHRSLSGIYNVTTPPLDVTRFALDKRLTYRKAAELGIATPWTLVVDDPAELRLGDLPYPLILKPAVNHHFFPHTNVKALPVDRSSDFESQYASMSKHIPPDEILIQERIPGGGENQFSFAALCKEGKAYASMVARRTRQYPLDFGTASTFVETIEQPVVETDGRKWLESVNFDGMAEVEFKFDPRDGRYKILDVNVRAWGWHTLGKAAGIDFSYLLWRHKVGLPIEPTQRRHGAAWVREINDVLAIAKSPQRGVEIKRLLKSTFRGECTYSTFDIRDPFPMVAEVGLRALQIVSSSFVVNAYIEEDLRI